MSDVRIKLMGLGRRKVYLQKCIKVNELLLEYENETSVRKRVFENHIKPVIFCSYVQFNNMLNESNPHIQLEQINAKITELESNATQKQAKILEYLNEKGDTTTSEIISLFSASKYKILYQINKLIDKSLVLRKKHPFREDIKLLCITDEGRKEIEKLNLNGGEDITIYNK